MEDENSANHDEDAVKRLKQELGDKDKEIKELRSNVKWIQNSDLEIDLDKAQRLMDEEKRRSEDYLTRLKFLQADFENYRKRVDREMRDVEDFSISGLMKKLLPVLDDLDLAVASAESNADAKSLLEGIGMVRKNLGSVLQSEGLDSIDALGKPFDPERHEAVERVDGTTQKEDTVVGEIRKGYIFKNKVLRPSMVKVESAVKNNGEIE
jgi:molecular chaperone GrpE